MRRSIGYNYQLAGTRLDLSDRDPRPLHTPPTRKENLTMKSRLFALLTAFTLAATLAACGDSAKEAADKAAAATKEATAKADAAAKDAAAKAADATKDAATTAADATKDAAAKAADATKDAMAPKK
jgi:hypothetical protein